MTGEHFRRERRVPTGVWERELRLSSRVHLSTPPQPDPFASATLLDVTDLRVGLNTSRGPADALRGISFSIDRGDTVGLIGESGCGKSMTALALMGLLPQGARVSGSIRFDSQELVGAGDAALYRERNAAQCIGRAARGVQADPQVVDIEQGQWEPRSVGGGRTITRFAEAQGDPRVAPRHLQRRAGASGQTSALNFP